MCPVNVHWHAGTEHLSQGEYDYDGKGPGVLVEIEDDYRRKLAMEGKEIRQGLRCHHYDETDEKYTKEYDWTYCVNMHVGETYEVSSKKLYFVLLLLIHFRSNISLLSLLFNRSTGHIPTWEIVEHPTNTNTHSTMEYFATLTMITK